MHEDFIQSLSLRFLFVHFGSPRIQGAFPPVEVVSSLLCLLPFLLAHTEVLFMFNHQLWDVVNFPIEMKLDFFGHRCRSQAFLKRKKEREANPGNADAPQPKQKKRKLAKTSKPMLS